MGDDKNGVIDNLLPQWIKVKLRKFLLDRESGEFNMVISEGGIRGLKRMHYDQPPDKKKEK